MHFGVTAPGKGRDTLAQIFTVEPTGRLHGLPLTVSPLTAQASANPGVVLKHHDVSRRPLECDRTDLLCVPQGW